MYSMSSFEHEPFRLSMVFGHHIVVMYKYESLQAKMTRINTGRRSRLQGTAFITDLS